MIQALYTASSGISAQQTRVDVIAANIANVNTPGYKNSRVDFKDMIYNDLRNPILANQGLAKLQQGNGILIAGILRAQAQGNIQPTGVLTDVAITGEGFFKVQAANGESLYTRVGVFSVSNVEDNNYLVDTNGNYVLDANDNPIQIDGDLSKLVISTSGDMSIGKEQPFAKLGIYKFENPEGLLASGDSYYQASAPSGEAKPMDKPSLRQGALEMSNVDLSLEMTRLIRAQRAYSLAGKAMQTADDMEGIANGMRR